MGKLPDLREYEGMGGRCTVARAFGGVIEFDDGSTFIMLSIAGREGKKLVHAIARGKKSKASDFRRRFAEEAQHEEGEGLTDFERKILQSVFVYGLTDNEREEYLIPDMEGEGEE